MISLGVLRALQIPTGTIGRHLTGSSSWVPYAITFAVTLLLIFLAVKRSHSAAKGKAVDTSAKERA